MIYSIEKNSVPASGKVSNINNMLGSGSPIADTIANIRHFTFASARVHHSSRVDRTVGKRASQRRNAECIDDAIWRGVGASTSALDDAA